MKPSLLLQKFLSTGTKPANQREASALLDESRSLLVSKLPTTAFHIQNLTQGDIDGIVAGGKAGMIDRAVAIHREQNLSAPRPSASPAATAQPSAASKPAPKPDRIHEMSAKIMAEAANARRQRMPAVKPVTAPQGRTDKRQGDLPVNQWAFGHLATAAQAGDKLAVAEIQRRGYEINANSTFSKKA